MVAFKSALVLLALSTEALTYSSPSVVCSSKLGTVSVKNPPRKTSTVTTTATVTRKVVRKVTSTVTPKPRTATKTSTIQVTVVTSAAPGVKTAIKTETDEQTVLKTRLLTDTKTELETTFTTKFITETIPAPAGFTAWKDAPDYVAKRRKARGTSDEDALVARAAPAGPLAGTKNGKALPCPKHVTRVDCVKKIPVTTTKKTTVTVQAPRTTLRPQTTTKAVKVTKTTTLTEYPPDVTNTITETVSPVVTKTVDEWTTETKVETVTVETQVPAAPEYAACSSSNLATTANGGQAISNIRVRQGFMYTTEYVASIHDEVKCCTECMKKPTCLFSLSSTDANKSCYHYTSSDSAVCANGQYQWASWYTRVNQTPYWYFSNGPCGGMNNLGTVQ